MIFNNYLSELRQPPLEGEEVAAIVAPFFSPDNLVAKCSSSPANRYSSSSTPRCLLLSSSPSHHLHISSPFLQEHIMDFTRLRALGSLFSMLNQMVGVHFYIP